MVRNWDNIDTARHYIFVPFADDDGGVTYTSMESFDIPDIDPLGPEKMQTLEFGYKYTHPLVLRG